MDITKLLEEIMEITERGPQPDKAPERVITCRLELLHMLLEKESTLKRNLDWQKILDQLLIPSLNNSKDNVRKLSSELIALMNGLIPGNKVRDIIANTGHLKQLKQQIIESVV